MKKCGIIVEPGYEPCSVELLVAAKKMYGEDPYKTIAISFDADDKLPDGYFDEIITIGHQENRSYDSKYTVNILDELHKKHHFDSILFSATHLGRMTAPRLAMRLGVGIVADVTEIKRTTKGVEMIRPAFSGKLMAVIESVGEKPVMMSIRPGVFSPEQMPDRTTVRSQFMPRNSAGSAIQQIARTPRTEAADIREAKVLVSGGGGIMQDFAILDELAKRLGGAKSASRRVVDSGKADRSIQVGQSGKVVHPELYMAIGIYGAVQHVAGLHKLKHLIAVNTNVQAPICSLADIVVEGDGADFIKSLMKRIDQG